VSALALLLLAAFLSLPVWKEDRAPELAEAKRAQLEQIQRAVHRAAKGDRRVEALTLANGWHESAYSLRIGRSECQRFECDPRKLRDGTLVHQARGYWQLHRNGLKLEQWQALHGPASLDAQATEAVKRVRAALFMCRGEPDEVLAAFRSFSGRGCRSPLKGEASRVETYRKLMR